MRHVGAYFVLVALVLVFTCSWARAATDPLSILDEYLDNQAADLADENGADYWFVQRTDIVDEPPLISARVQITIGCEVPMGAAPLMQEAEVRVALNYEAGRLVRAERVPSPVLPDGGVERFGAMYCAAPTY